MLFLLEMIVLVGAVGYLLYRAVLLLYDEDGDEDEESLRRHSQRSECGDE